MGLKESGLRGSLRNVSVGIDAIPDSVVDDFERDDPLDDWSQETDVWDVETDNPLEGEQSIETSSDSGSGSRIELSSSPIDRLPERGDRFSYIGQTPEINDSRLNFLFGWDGTFLDNGYDVGYNDGNIFLRFGGDDIARTSVNASDYEDEAVEYEVSWTTNNDEIILKTFEFNISSQERGEKLDEISGTDDNSSSGSIGFFSGGDSGKRIVDRVLILETGL